MHQANIAAGSDHTRAVVGRLQIGLNRDDTCISSLLSLDRIKRAHDGQKGQS
jgi:hypothetical protein